MTREEVKVFLHKVKQIFKDRFSVDSQEAYDAWCDCMSDVRAEVANKALTEYVKNNKYAPTIADIREVCDQLWEDHQALVRHINESFELAAGFYPNIDEDQREHGRKIFVEVISGIERKDRERVAQRISQKIIGLVRLCEVGTDKTIEPFDKCMERVANEFRSGKKCNR